MTTSDRTSPTRLDRADHGLLAALLSSTVDGVYAVDGRGRVLFANHAAMTILGYDDEAELVGRESHATIHHSHPDGEPFPESECPLLRVRTSGEPVRVEQDWFVRKDATFVPGRLLLAPMSLDGAAGAVVVFRDTGDRDRAEAERRRAEAIDASRARLARAGCWRSDAGSGAPSTTGRSSGS